MSITVLDAGDSCSITLSGEVSIATVAQLKTALAVAIFEHQECEVDLSAVEVMDTAGLQLMLMAKRCQAKTVRFVRHSAAVLQAVELANLGQRLGDPLLFQAASGMFKHGGA